MRNFKIWLPIILLILIIIFLIYLFSAGTIDLSKNNKLPEDIKDNEKEAKAKEEKRIKYISELKERIRKNELNKAIEDKKKYIQELNRIEEFEKKLIKRYKNYYSILRCIIVIIWLLILFVLFHFNYISNIEGVITYSELILIIVFTLNFLAFGSLSNLERAIKLMKVKLRNAIYRNYENLFDKKEFVKQGIIETENKIYKLNESQL